MTKYILMVLVGGATFGFLSSFVKISYQEGFNAAEISFSQALLGAVALWLYTLINQRGKSKPQITKKDYWSLLFTGLTLGITTYLYYLSVHYIPASIAIVILMQFTWFSLLIEWVFFKKKPSKIEIVIVLFILAGTVLAGNLLHIKEFSLSLEGIFYVLLSSLTYALYIVANSRVNGKIPWQNKSAVIMTGSAIAIFLVNFQTLIWHNHFGVDLLKWAIFLSVFGTIIPPVLFSIGIPKVGAGISSILMTIELPVAVISAHLVLNEEINYVQIAGIVIMIAAISAMNFYKVKPKTLQGRKVS